jgi:hypothetical protein
MKLHYEGIIYPKYSSPISYLQNGKGRKMILVISHGEGDETRV